MRRLLTTTSKTRRNFRALIGMAEKADFILTKIRFVNGKIVWPGGPLSWIKRIMLCAWILRLHNILEAMCNRTSVLDDSESSGKKLQTGLKGNWARLLLRSFSKENTIVYMLKTISSQIKIFEQVYNGIEEAFIDVSKIRKVKGGFLCTVTIHEDDFSSKTVYENILYPLKISKLI